MRCICCRCRPIQPKALNQWHYMACTIMAFAGGLFGVVLGNSFINEFYTAYPANNRYWQVGICPTASLDVVFDLVVIGLLYKAYPNGCGHKFTFLPRLRPDPMRGHRLLCS